MNQFAACSGNLRTQIKMTILSLRTIRIASTILIAISIAFQFHILHRIYNTERKQFDTHVVKSANVLFEEDVLTGDHTNLFSNAASTSNYYLVPFDSLANEDHAIGILAREFSDYELPCSFKFHVSYGNNVSYSKLFAIEINDHGFEKMELKSTALLPSLDKPHIYIQFAGKNSFLIKKISPWILSYLILIFFLTVIALALYNFYKHRFWNGVQKEFINNFIHEFRTPLSVISIGSRVLQSNSIENDSRRFKKYARMIKEQTDQLEQKVSQILQLSLSGKKSSYLKTEFVDVNTLIANAISLVEPLMQEKKATIEFIPCGNGSKLFGDTTYLTQAMVNLLDNSLKYANRPHIRLETFVSEKICTISMRDNGIGMEKKYFKHIFRKYYRIPTGDVHNVKGFGIGLNFVKNVIDAHKGRIEVSSTPGKGTEFRIKLPLT